MSVFGPFEFESDTPLLRVVRRAFAVGFHFEGGLCGWLECHRVTTNMERDRFTAVEFIDDRLEVRWDPFWTLALLRFEEQFLRHTRGPTYREREKRRGHRRCSNDSYRLDRLCTDETGRSLCSWHPEDIVASGTDNTLPTGEVPRP